MKKLLTIIVVLLVTVSLQAQDPFNNSYKYKVVKEYNPTTEVYEFSHEDELTSIIFFNIKDTKNAKLLMDGSRPIIFYLLTKNEDQPNDSYTKFTAYTEEGTEIQGALGDGWISFFIDNLIITYSEFPSNKE